MSIKIYHTKNYHNLPAKKSKSEFIDPAGFWDSQNPRRQPSRALAYREENCAVEGKISIFENKGLPRVCWVSNKHTPIRKIRFEMAEILI